MGGSERARLGRRALLAAGAAGVAAAAAQAVAPGQVRAANGDPVKIGQMNSGTANTYVHATGANGLWAISTTGFGLYGESFGTNGIGVGGLCHQPDGWGALAENLSTGAKAYLGGTDGVLGDGGSACPGVHGTGAHADGVLGESYGPGKSGVHGFNNDPAGYGVHGENPPSGSYGHLGSQKQGVYGNGGAAGVGVRGESAAADGVAGKSNAPGASGVHGITSHAAGYGVYAENVASGNIGHLGSADHGVFGSSASEGAQAVTGEHSQPTATAVLGVNTATGVRGALGAGDSGVLGFAPTDLAHHGLNVSGRVAFADRSGTLTVAKNKSAASVSVAALSSASKVVATLQANRTGVYIQAAVPYPGAGKITVYLNKKVSSATKVAYFILD